LESKGAGEYESYGVITPGVTPPSIVAPIKCGMGTVDSIITSFNISMSRVTSNEPVPIGAI